MMEAEIGVVQLPGKEHQALLGATRNWKKHARILSQSLQRKLALPAPCFGLLASRTKREYISVVLSHLVCGILLWQPKQANIYMQRSLKCACVFGLVSYISAICHKKNNALSRHCSQNEETRRVYPNPTHSLEKSPENPILSQQSHSPPTDGEQDINVCGFIAFGACLLHRIIVALTDSYSAGLAMRAEGQEAVCQNLKKLQITPI